MYQMSTFTCTDEYKNGYYPVSINYEQQNCWSEGFQARANAAPKPSVDIQIYVFAGCTHTPQYRSSGVREVVGSDLAALSLDGWSLLALLAQLQVNWWAIHHLFTANFLWYICGWAAKEY